MDKKYKFEVEVIRQVQYKETVIVELTADDLYMDDETESDDIGDFMDDWELVAEKAVEVASEACRDNTNIFQQDTGELAWYDGDNEFFVDENYMLVFAAKGDLPGIKGGARAAGKFQMKKKVAV